MLGTPMKATELTRVGWCCVQNYAVYARRRSIFREIVNISMGVSLSPEAQVANEVAVSEVTSSLLKLERARV
jgi:hypothetical protein